MPDSCNGTPASLYASSGSALQTADQGSGAIAQLVERLHGMRIVPTEMLSQKRPDRCRGRIFRDAHKQLTQQAESKRSSLTLLLIIGFSCPRKRSEVSGGRYLIPGRDKHICRSGVYRRLSMVTPAAWVPGCCLQSLDHDVRAVDVSAQPGSMKCVDIWRRSARYSPALPSPSMRRSRFAASRRS
jgi:hypothetical protein